MGPLKQAQVQMYVTTDRLLEAGKRQQDLPHYNFPHPLLRFLFFLGKKLRQSKD